MPARLGIIGGGVMGEALLSRLLALGHYEPRQVLTSDPSPERRHTLTEQYDIRVTDSNREVIESSQTILLAVKPQVFDRVANDFQGVRCEVSPLILSILAGVTLARLEAAIPGWPIVRVMPNTPATVGVGMTAISPGSRTLAEHSELAEHIFKAVGQVVRVPEALMDAVTGLSGSGPGYVAVVIEALADGGVAAGLPRAVANQLAVQTVLGTAQLLQQTGMHPAVLKDRVTSPGGTTIMGVACLEELGLRSALIEAVLAASKRSRELGAQAGGKN
ncbi:pyrroline-5-carboxylate reductase [Romeria aff. gracilis LEGE 07310]|uniref:Pyrroline-5-carboxylate reductase n=1 Tax=Vasconcelosia minhoensis LEGE 07310 TaxID=915328 RepID=A0A8J7DRB3_9CYAN|nr:pyrroline-5-carboxylate reductase [Romeria gracilis]MBE9078154.1 pyrroline-5-carboxylate reductase [Romeria aff. gracilis LEGE 07310]